MDNTLYPYSPITERPALTWPGGHRVAFYLGLNIEHYRVDRPSTSIFGGTAGLSPDPLNYGWRDYGPRVGIWRMISTLDRLGLRASAMVNSDVMTRYPQIVRAGVERDWAWVAHGQDNSTFEAGLDTGAERAHLRAVVAAIETATGRRPRGWLGPALTETYATPGLLAELGLDYTLDWCCDDQPFALDVDRPRPFLSVPYSIEVNDVSLFIGKSLSGPDFQRIVIDQFEQLYADSAHSGRVMALCVHPFIVNQPFRHRYLERALEHIVSTSGVWCTTSDDIARWYLDGVA
ncbi:MAG TPA: polysaccharide deacetylase family protein [Mycobacteriales bacterium]|jgi:peptidoglycan/xylan/chitin deacetylase (PgdA/CDA1 family)|nr:polysaccharide deacetylase family protein [Mycobacteriales bacterium]